MADFNFEFDFDNDDTFHPVTFHDKVEKQKLMEFEQELQTKDSPDRRSWISESAYYKAERRNFAPGLELDDWLEAEKEFLKQGNK